MKLLVSSISSDSHTWNLVFIELLLRELGHEVINLGPCVPREELVAQCLEHRPDVLVVSSVNGHANIEAVEIIRLIRRSPELDSMRTVVGGKLGIQGVHDREHIPLLLSEGFDAVFCAEDDPLDHFLAFLGSCDERRSLALCATGDLS